jgi:hypothetical protein
MSAALPQHYSQHVLHCAGLQELSRLQRLELLHVPCTDLHAIALLAAHLPALRILDLRCSSTAGVDEEAVGQLSLAAATALTELRLHVHTYAIDTVQRLQMPPRLQVLTAQGCKNVDASAWSHAKDLPCRCLTSGGS